MVIGIKLLLSWIGNALLFISIGGQRYQSKALALYWLAVAVADGAVSILLCLLLPMPYSFNVSVWLSMVIMGIAFFYAHEGRLGEKLFRFLCVTCIAAVVGVVNEAVYPTFADTTPTYALLSGPIKIAICGALALIYRLFIAQTIDQIFHQLDGRWRWINITGLAATVMCYFIGLHYMSGELTFLMTTVMVLLTAVNYICLCCILYFMSRAIDLSQSRLQEEMLLGQVERLMDFEEQSRIMRHDLRHHNQAITTFLQNGQQQELADYLAEYDQSLTEESQPHYCNHPLVSNVLGVYHTKAKSAGVDFHPQVVLSADCGMGQRELLGLLSNLLENALHGCDGKGEINLQLFPKDKKLVILCENTAPHPVTFQEGIPQAKGRKSSGITSILRIVNRYDGMADFRQCQEVFTAHIILNLK